MDWDNFRTFRNNVISKVEKRKLDYFDELTEKISNQECFGSKDRWKLVKSVLTKKVSALTEEIPHCVKMEQLFMQIIVIMYIYHALINALSAHMIHINLNTIFCTHVEYSPTQNKEKADTLKDFFIEL